MAHRLLYGFKLGSMSIDTCLYACLDEYSYVYLTICMSIRMPVHMSIHMFICTHVETQVYLLHGIELGSESLQLGRPHTVDCCRQHSSAADSKGRADFLKTLSVSAKSHREF